MNNLSGKLGVKMEGHCLFWVHPARQKTRGERKYTRLTCEHCHTQRGLEKIERVIYFSWAKYCFSFVKDQLSAI